MNILRVRKYYTNQSRVMEQAKLTCSFLEKAVEKQIKTIEDQGKKQAEALKVLRPVEHQQKAELIKGIFAEDLKSSEIKKEINEIKQKLGRTN